MKKLWAKYRDSKVLLWLVFALYILFNFILFLHHTPYRDEANVWLMAKYLSPISLIKEIHYQGHPCLWYFLAMPFAKLGLPYKTIEVMSFAVMAVTIWLLLFKSRMPLVLKALFAFSPFATYFYPVIARNYCLIALILMTLALVYDKRNEKPVLYGLLLGLLVQADTIAIVTAGLISMMWLYENGMSSLKTKKWDKLLNAAKGLWIPLASLLFWFYQMRNVSDCTAYEVKTMGIGELLYSMRNYALYIISRLTGWGKWSIVIFFLVFVVSAIYLSLTYRKVTLLLVVIGTYLFQITFSALVYELHIWHFLSLGYVIAWFVWIVKDEQQTESAKPLEEKSAGLKRTAIYAEMAFAVSFAVLLIGMMAHWNSDAETSNLNQALHGQYSDGKNAAEFVKKNIDKDALILSTNVAHDSAVLAYLDDYRFYYAATGERTTYATWSESQTRTTTVEQMQELVKQNFGTDSYYVIVSGGTCLENPEELQKNTLLYQSEKPATKGETYRIYQVN